MRREFLGLGFAALVFAGVAPHAQADTFPSKPFRFIVPFPAGGATDAAARAMQPQLEKLLGQTVVIENRAGAGAVIGLDVIAKSAPDGYTFGIGPAGALSVNPAMQVKMPFDVRKDLTPISGLCETPFILAASANYPANSLQEVIAQAKASPGKLTIGHGGNGTSMFYAALLFTTMADVKVGFVPYRGTVLVANDLIGGHIGLGIVDPPPSQAAILDGRIKGIAISSKHRARFFPKIPTFDEQGLKGYEVGGWFGLVGPAGIPPDTLAKLNAAIVTALKDPEVVQRIHDIGMEPQPMTPAEFGALIDREIDKITKVLAQAGDIPKDEPR
ncbi:Bug family tripartite tricarboxylate transporter substrate binding protein [Rhodoplanes sp. Z2-YC6860]|uniref:Bug family tripartite tricarboxylate transporter substrate binding protein n=1 Tax=Rhodoplanes sp. Z2-YC6860 TaxID=674703 RepID=UPI00078C8E9D|nr:tripartite tricarboxylate transporter substrate binding protein [Rhodoplanes sp. Z2-YC6860]AMN43389.1 extracytoplasmic binding receptor [Rhodoplanes sp. Z2-YC6860]